MSKSIHILVFFGHLSHFKEAVEPSIIDFIYQQKIKFSTVNFASNEVLLKLKGLLKAKLYLF